MRSVEVMLLDIRLGGADSPELEIPSSKKWLRGFHLGADRSSTEPPRAKYRLFVLKTLSCLATPRPALPGQAAPRLAVPRQAQPCHAEL